MTQALGHPVEVTREIAESMGIDRPFGALVGSLVVGLFVLVLYAGDRLGMNEVGFGLLTTAVAVGGIVGIVSYGSLERRFSLGDGVYEIDAIGLTGRSAIVTAASAWASGTTAQKPMPRLKTRRISSSASVWSSVLPDAICRIIEQPVTVISATDR